jgi:hypothetical protein
MARASDEPESDRGVDNALTARLDRDREFKRRHGGCERCGGTGFEWTTRTEVRGTRTFEYPSVKRCEALGLGPIEPPLQVVRGFDKSDGFSKAADVRLPYRERE